MPSSPPGPLRLRALGVHPTAWDPREVDAVLNCVMDAAIVEAEPPEGARISYSHVVVLDNFFGEDERKGLLEAITTQSGCDHTEGPPEEKWERGTCDGAGMPPTWGLKASVLDWLSSAEVPAVLEIQSRLCKLYPEYEIVHLPSDVIQGRGRPPQPDVTDDSVGAAAAGSSSSGFDCCPILANAAVAGDCFQWHVDADPSSLPASSWTNTFGDYCNGQPGKPLLVSLLLYLDEDWPQQFDAETLFLDSSADVGVFVRPKACRAVVMDQDVLHRLSAPSILARRPRYSLVWKLVFLPRQPGGRCCIARSEWGRPSPVGSAAKLERMKKQISGKATCDDLLLRKKRKTLGQ